VDITLIKSILLTYQWQTRRYFSIFYLEKIPLVSAWLFLCVLNGHMICINWNKKIRITKQSFLEITLENVYNSPAEASSSPLLRIFLGGWGKSFPPPPKSFSPQVSPKYFYHPLHKGSPHSFRNKYALPPLPKDMTFWSKSLDPSIYPTGWVFF
jgi:hypothetical protein